MPLSRPMALVATGVEELRIQGPFWCLWNLNPDDDHACAPEQQGGDDDESFDVSGFQQLDV
jgi:hypothetical protein